MEKKDLEEIAKVVIEKDLYVISDEIYGEGRHFIDLTSLVQWNNEVDDLYYINVQKDNLDTLEDMAKL